MIEVITIAYDLQEFDNDSGYTAENFEDMLEHTKVCLDMIDDSKLTEAEHDALNAIASFVYNIHA